jgi:hypothetical protein
MTRRETTGQVLPCITDHDLAGGFYTSGTTGGILTLPVPTCVSQPG